MIATNVRFFVDAGDALRLLDRALLDLSQNAGVSVAAVPKPQFDSTVSIMKALLTHCGQLRLQITPTLVKKFLATAEGAGTCSALAAYTAVSGSRDAFKAELESQLFLQVFPHRISYYTREHTDGQAPWIGGETKALLVALEGFKDSHFDAMEAGNCISFGRSTAGVYHLMRIAEYGLVAVATAANVPDIEHRSWDKMLAGIHKHIKTIESQSQPGWLEQRKRFSDLCSWLTVIKSGWRNPVSHIPRSYSEATAMSMFSAVKTLFERLNAEHFAPAQMPAGQINPEDDDASVSKQLPVGQSQTSALS
jgi:hypothetical protein